MKRSIKLIVALSIGTLLIAGCSSSSNDSLTTAADMSDTEASGTTDAGEGGGEMSELDTNTDDSNNVDLNGNYDVFTSLNSASAVIPECSQVEGALTVTGTTITGIVDGNLTLTGTINSDLTITGGFAFDGGAKFADYSGMVSGEVLLGDWEDIQGCSGTWRAEKS